MGAGIFLMFLGLALLFAPWFVESEMPLLARGIFSALGIAGFLIGGLLIIITKLYVKASAEMSFVRTGMGGPKVILDGGCLVIPVVHTVVSIMLNTFKLEIERREAEALITGDKLRADIKAEFYIRVAAESDDILQAARSLGGKSLQGADAVTGLVGDKLVSALRSVAAKSPLENLNIEREKFANDVAEAVRADIKQNGLTLETVTISSLDQTPIEFFKADNVFDAEGRQRIAQITSENAVRENEFRRTAEQEIAEKDAQTREEVAQREYREKQADAKRDADVAKAEAEQARAAEVFTAEQQWQTRQAQLAAEQQIGERDAQKDREVRLAEINANQAAQTADVEREREVEVAKRQQMVAIAKAEQEQAMTRAEQLRAEQEREKEKQGVITVEEVAEAGRDKQVQVIVAEQKAEVERVQDFMAADIEAYQKAKIAEGERDAAAKTAEAIRLEAEARKDASVLQAEGEQAVKMVPVNVDNEQVTVEARRQKEAEQERVSVLLQELKAKATYEQVAVELEQALKLIDAARDVGVAGAEAFGQALGDANVTLFGDPDTMEQFSRRYFGGVGVNAFAQGLLAGGDGPVTTGLQTVMSRLAGRLNQPAAGRLEGLVGELEGLAKDNPNLAPIAARFSSLVSGPEEAAPEEPESKGEAGGGSTPKRRR
jgi:uncharacterized membrane protein YqiK